MEFFFSIWQLNWIEKINLIKGKTNKTIKQQKLWLKDEI